MNDPVKPELGLPCKVVSVLGHLEEVMSKNGHGFDIMAMKSALGDPEVKKWIKDMGVYAPLKR